MKKDLRGKVHGRGISQREDGLYVARYTNKYGKLDYAYQNDVILKLHVIRW